MKITKLFAVVALMASPVLAESQGHAPSEAKPPPAKPDAKPGKDASGKPVPPKPAPEPGMHVKPRVTANGRPACGNVASRMARSSDCKP